MARIEAAIKVYALLWRLNVVRGDAMKKLTGMLLHPYPKVHSPGSCHGALFPLRCFSYF